MTATADRTRAGWTPGVALWPLLVAGCASMAPSPSGGPSVTVAPPASVEAGPHDDGPRRPRVRRGGPIAPTADFGRCLRSRECQHEGWCSPLGGRCAAADDDDCSGSDACLGGRCTARDGLCVAGSDAACRDSVACTAWGRCFTDGSVCVARDAADCQASTRCRREGHCALHGGECTRP